MNFLTCISGSGTVRVPLSSIRLALLGAAICLLGLPRAAQATASRTDQMRALTVAAPIPIRFPLRPSDGTATGNTALQLQSIPEPQTWLTAFSGLGTLLALQRFRRSRNSRRS